MASEDGRMESPAREELARAYGECPHGNRERYCLACAVLPRVTEGTAPKEEEG